MKNDALDDFLKGFGGGYRENDGPTFGDFVKLNLILIGCLIIQSYAVMISWNIFVVDTFYLNPINFPVSFGAVILLKLALKENHVPSTGPAKKPRFSFWNAIFTETYTCGIYVLIIWLISKNFFLPS